MSGTPTDAAAAVRNAHAWFEHNSGWAPPDADTLEEWVADGVCRCPDECLVAPRGWCEHGLASWALVLEALDELDHAGRARRFAAGGQAWDRSGPAHARDEERP